MSKKACPLCDKKVEGTDYLYHTEIEKVIINIIKRNHPHWVEEDGACPKCVEYYRAIFGKEDNNK